MVYERSFISVIFFLHLVPVIFLHLIPIDGQTRSPSKDNRSTYQQQIIHGQVVPSSNAKSLPSTNYPFRSISANNANQEHSKKLTNSRFSKDRKTKERLTQDYVATTTFEKIPEAINHEVNEERISHYHPTINIDNKNRLENKDRKESEERSNQHRDKITSEHKSSMADENRKALKDKPIQEQELFLIEGGYNPFSLNTENDPLTTTRKSFGALMPPPITIHDTSENLEPKSHAHDCLLPCTLEDIKTPICACNFNNGKVASFRHRCDLNTHNCKFSTDFKVIAEGFCPWEIKLQGRKDERDFEYSHPKYYN